MPRYSQGAIVLQQDSPWTEFLNGIGQGVSMGVKNRINKADEKDKIAQQVLFASMKNEIDPSLLAGDDAQRFFERVGIFDHPDIQGLIASARQSLPKEMTEAPPTPGAEYVQSTPLSGGGSPVIGEESMGSVRPGEMPPGMAAMPTPQITPTSKAVHEYLINKAEKRKLAYEAEQGRQQQYRSLENAFALRRFDLGQTQSVAEQIKEKIGLLERMGYVPGRDATINISGKNLVSVSLHPYDQSKLDANKDKAETKALRVDDKVSSYTTARTTHVYRLQDLLSKDTVTLESMALDESEDPQVRALYLAAAAAVSSKAPTNQKVGEIIDRVEASIKVINDSLDTYNNEIGDMARAAGISPEQTSGKLLKKITFEEVSGGLTPDQYRAKKNPPTAGKLISQVRDDYQPSRITSNLPASSSGKESDRVQDAYKGIAGVVQAAMGSNQGLTRGSIRGNIMEMKDQIMAEYGLNEKSFSLLMTMADRAMA